MCVWECVLNHLLCVQSVSLIRKRSNRPNRIQRDAFDGATITTKMTMINPRQIKRKPAAGTHQNFRSPRVVLWIQDGRVFSRLKLLLLLVYYIE